MALVNVMEEIVNMKMHDALKNFDCCKCDQCLEDIKCITLNNLPPKYVSSKKGELFSRINSTSDRQKSLDIDAQIMKAIDFVKENPHHDIPPDENNSSDIIDIADI